MFELEDYDLDDEVFLNTQMPSVNNESSNSNGFASNFENTDEITDKILKTDNETKTTKPTNECQTNKTKLNFDDDFDSDDEVFSNVLDVLDDPLNSSKLNISSTESDLKTDVKSIASFSSESENSMLNSPKAKNSIKSSFGSLLNTIVTSVKTMIPKCAYRKFPGPAGLLSENVMEDLNYEDPSELESLDMSTIISDNDKKEESLCTQSNDSSFTSSPYQQFLSDFFSTDVDILLDKYNVAWIKQKLLPYTASGRFYTDKIPFFVSVIKEIDCLSPDPTVVLADKTGYIRGTIHRAVWNQFSSQLKLGAILVLSKVGVSCQKIVKGFTLNITSDHLVAIYSVSSEDVQEVIVTRTTDLSNEEIVNNAKRWNSFNIETTTKSTYSEISCKVAVLDDLKLHDKLSDQSSQQSNAFQQMLNVTPVRSLIGKNSFKPKTPVAHVLFNKNSIEEPPFKRPRFEEHKTRTEDYSNNEMSIIENIFEGINEDDIFGDFCC